MNPKHLCKVACVLYPKDCPHAADELSNVFDHAEGPGQNCRHFEKRKSMAAPDVTKALLPLGELPGPMEMIEGVQVNHPIYFDKTRSYWVWLHDEKRYVMVDETDILNAIYKISGMDRLVECKFRKEILTAIQMTGRLLKPKEPDKNWIQFMDRCVDIRKDTEIEATPEYLFASLIPHKIGDTEDTPYIDSLFVDWVGEDNKELLYEIIAVCMLNDYPIHRMFWLTGSGRNGKDQFIELVHRVIGRDNCTATDLERIADSRFESARMYKKLVACVSETDHNVLKKTNLLKALTGSSQIPGEFKNKTPFSFKSTATVIIAMNSVPIVHDRTEGWHQRIIIVDFFNKFGEGNDILAKITETEYENLCRKCVNLLPGLLDKGVFTNELSLIEKREQYENKSNPIGQFINEECVQDVNSIVPMRHLYKECKEYLLNKGLRTYTKEVFRRELKAMGYELETNHVFTEYLENGKWTAAFGIKLKTSPYQKNSEHSAQSALPNEERAAVNADNADNADYFHSEPRVGGVSGSSPHTPHTPQSSIIDQTITMFETVKKEMVNSTNVNEFVDLFQSSNPDITKDYVISYLEHLGRLTPKAKSNGDKSCIICGKPGRHKSTTVVGRNTRVVEWRCDVCYEQYQRGPGVTTS